MNQKEFVEREFEIAKKVVCHHLENSTGLLSFNNLIMITGGDKQVLMEYLKAFDSIFKDAIIYLEYLINKDK